MSNLTERLFDEAQDDPDSLYWQAADRIAELEGELHQVEANCDHWADRGRIAEARLDAVMPLLKAATCPNCDGGGAYYTSDGNVAQCQWCDERKQALEQKDGEQNN